jgi:hypothetical protein
MTTQIVRFCVASGSHHDRQIAEHVGGSARGYQERHTVEGSG